MQEIVRVYFQGFIDQKVPKTPYSHQEAERIVTNKLNAERASFKITGTDNPSNYE